MYNIVTICGDLQTMLIRFFIKSYDWLRRFRNITSQTFKNILKGGAPYPLPSSREYYLKIHRYDITFYMPTDSKPNYIYLRNNPRTYLYFTPFLPQVV